MTHYFGSDPKGVFGATPFEVLHQLLLGLLKYILDLLYNYQTIPKDWESFFKKRSCPEVPNRYSEANETGLPPVDQDHAGALVGAFTIGALVEVLVGALVGVLVGALVGVLVGALVGVLVGALVGAGDITGDIVGFGVGGTIKK